MQSFEVTTAVALFVFQSLRHYYAGDALHDNHLLIVAYLSCHHTR